MPAPELYIDHPEHGMLLTRHRPELAAGEIVDQLIVEEVNGQRHHIRLYPRMSATQLKAKFDALGVKGKVSLCYNWNESHDGSYRRLVTEAFGVDVPTASSSIEAGMSRAQARFTFKVNTHYFRAVAKIAFHYYLIHTKRFLGDEACFCPIRTFILEGGHTDEFFAAPKVFADEADVPGVASSRWLHFCASYERPDFVVGYVRLFHGPRFAGEEYHVLLGRPESRIALPIPAWAHAYVCDRPASRRGKVGEVQRVLLTRIR